MKKLTSLLLAALMLFSVLLTSCGQTENGFDYQNEDLTPYVTLNYLANKLQVDVGMLEDQITEADVNEYIDDLLVSKKAVYKTITETGIVCEMGDTVGITYKGVKVSALKAAGYAEDGAGLTAEQIKGLAAFSGGEATTTQSLTLGSGAYIDGFEEGLDGKKIGDKNIALPLTFPDDYSNSDLKGQSVVFFVTIVNKLQTVDPRDLDFKDMVYLTYTAVLDEASVEYKEEAEEAGLLKEEADSLVLTLSKDNQFHAALINAFNEMADDDRFGTEFTFSEIRTVSVTVETGTEGGDNATEGGEPSAQADDTTTTKESREVTVNYTVTVHKLANTRYWTSADAESGNLKFSDFCTKAGISSTEFADYAAYKKEVSDNLQLERDIQIQADRRQGAFAALVEKSEVDLSAEKVKELINAYFNEVKENIDYMTIQVQTNDSMYYQYQLYTLYYGSVSVRSYVLSSYGYTEKDLDITNKTSKLMTDAEEYVTERMVFWQYVKENNIPALTDEEYNKGYEEYKRLYAYDESEHEDHDHEAGDMLSEMGITEEQLREALFWDKVTGYLVDNHCTINPVPVKED